MRSVKLPGGAALVVQALSPTMRKHKPARLAMSGKFGFKALGKNPSLKKLNIIIKIIFQGIEFKTISGADDAGRNLTQAPNGNNSLSPPMRGEGRCEGF